MSSYCEENGFSRQVCEGGIYYLLDCWTTTVSEVEDVYLRIFDEYLNELDVRRIIEELLPYASDIERVEADARLPRLDDRFRAATRPVEVCVWGKENATTHDYCAEREW